MREQEHSTASESRQKYEHRKRVAQCCSHIPYPIQKPLVTTERPRAYIHRARPDRAW